MGETMRGAEALGRKAGSLVQSLLGWGFGVTALIMTLGQAFSAFSMWAVLCGALLTALLIPPSRIKLRSLLPFMPKGGVPSRWVAEVSYEGQIRTINEMR